MFKAEAAAVKAKLETAGATVEARQHSARGNVVRVAPCAIAALPAGGTHGRDADSAMVSRPLGVEKPLQILS